MADAAIGRAAASRMLSLQPHGRADVLAARIAEAVASKRPRVVYPRVNALARYFPTVTRWMMDRFTPEFRTDAARGS